MLRWPACVRQWLISSAVFHISPNGLCFTCLPSVVCRRCHGCCSCFARQAVYVGPTAKQSTEGQCRHACAVPRRPVQSIIHLQVSLHHTTVEESLLWSSVYVESYRLISNCWNYWNVSSRDNWLTMCLHQSCYRNGLIIRLRRQSWTVLADILCAVDSGELNVLLTLLVLSTVFDTVDPKVLPVRDVGSWMPFNRLQLNKLKTEIMWCASTAPESLKACLLCSAYAQPEALSLVLCYSFALPVTDFDYSLIVRE